MNRRDIQSNLGIAALAVLLTAALYLGIAGTVFEWRHPKANRTALWRHFGTVLQFGTIPDYQHREDDD